MHIKLDYDLNLAQRLQWADELDWEELDLKPRELELITDYILHADEKAAKQPSKYVKPKCNPAGLVIEQDAPPAGTYLYPRPELHTEDPVIAAYIESIEMLKVLETRVEPENAWKIRRWRLEHSLDMGLANSTRFPTFNTTPTFSSYAPIELDNNIDLTNSFHIAKLVDFYSQLKQSDSSALWINWVETNVIEKADLFPWQKHLLIRRIDGTNQLTIGRELGEFFGKIVTPSTMSQALRTIYRQIAIAAERELYIFYIKDYDPAWKVCRKCGTRKLIQYDYFPSKPNICKVCATTKKGAK